jgi:hypothetical protein
MFSILTTTTLATPTLTFSNNEMCEKARPFCAEVFCFLRPCQRELK